MRKKKVLGISTFLLILFGLAAILIGIFAYKIGLDNNPVMGPKRKFLIGLGAMFLLIRPVWTVAEKVSRNLGLKEKLARLASRWQGIWLSRWLTSTKKGPLGRFLETYAWVWTLLAGVVVAVTALWYLTAGTFTHWTEYTHYFSQQADGFLAGQLSLVEEPPVEFATLQNVYDWKQRQGINYIWDASYYNGKYYLYWGPMPALLAAGIKLVHPGVLEDQVLVLIYITGMALILGALFHWLHKKYIPSVPAWTIFLFTLVSIFSVHVFWLINRPDVYEAAIASAQFFLLFGIYATLRSLGTSEKGTRWLVLAGFGFGAAVASRFSYVFAVIFASGVIAFELIKRGRSSGWKIKPWLAYFLVLGAFAAGLAWYNYARFGSIFESGMKYQLTGDAVPRDFSKIFSPAYIIPNLYSEVLRPLVRTPGKFPFFSTPFIMDNMWPNWVHRVKTYYFGEQVVGVLPAIPYLWLLVLPPVKWIRRFLDWTNERTASQVEQHQNVRLPAWVLWLLVGMTIVQIMATLCFVQASMRYAVDFTVMLVVCTSMAVWEASVRLEYKPGWRKIFHAVVLMLALASISVGLLVNMQGADYRFANNNPDLYGSIARFLEGL